MNAIYRGPLILGLVVCLFGGMYIGNNFGSSSGDIVIILLISQIVFITLALVKNIEKSQIIATSIALLVIGYLLIIVAGYITFFNRY